MFELANFAFAVEIALAVVRKDTSAMHIKNKQDLYRALTNRETLGRILEQGWNYILSDWRTLGDTSQVPGIQLQKE